jgi:pimeloyl-ACP methyl ester carboxylesterase
MSCWRLLLVMRYQRRLIAAVALLGLGATTAACTSASAHRTTSALRGISCPADVELQLVLTHACFRLATPVDRRHPNGAKVSLFVLRLTPPGTSSPDPMVVLGTDVGDTPGYGGMAALPERVHRVTYIVDPRGVGHSTPLQTCPEANPVTVLTTDEGSALADASARCLSRLRAAGEDPALFGPDAVAADAIDLRRALGVTHWNLLTFGSASVTAQALVLRDGHSVRSLVEDSPSPTTPSTVVSQSREAYARLAAECLAGAACHRAFPQVAELWSRASRRLQRQLLATPAGQVSAAVLDELVRNLLAGDGPSGPSALPAGLSALGQGHLTPELSATLARDSAGCIGYRPECLPGVSLAAFLTVTCSTAPSGVYLAACATWPRVHVPEGIASSVSTLILFGALDPYVDAHRLLAAAGKTTFVVEVPHQTHNALGFDECPIAIRNAWVDEPATSPRTDCLTGMRPLSFTTNP